MIEVVLGSIMLIVLLIIGIEGSMSRRSLQQRLISEGELVKENLNHLAGAIISLSELLDDADQVIENISQVPTVGEIIQQALMGFITQKMQGALPEPLVEPVKEIINEKTDSLLHAEGKIPKENNKKKI